MSFLLHINTPRRQAYGLIHMNTEQENYVKLKIVKLSQVLSDFGLVAPTTEMARLLATKPGTNVYLYHVSNKVSY